MKKLMFAAAVAAGLAVFGEGIESANTVGYNTVNPEYTYTMFSIPFTAVGGESLTLDSINAEIAEDDEIQVSWMDDDGYIQFDSFFYKNALGAIYPQDGWYDSSDEYAGDSFTLTPGLAVWLITEQSEVESVTVSGEVGAVAKTQGPFEYEYSMIASAFPVPFNPNAESVTWVGIQEDDEIQVPWMDDDGYIQFTSYFFKNQLGAIYPQDGWYDDSDTFAEDAITGVGQGFWLITQSPDEVTLTEASPLAPAANE